MFLKSLLISTPTRVIRDLKFRKGLNLIIDETPDVGTSTGNNVGKTTILKLIDFCLGQEKNVVYTNPENKRQECADVKEFLVNEKVIITLTLVDDLENPSREVEISRNFAARSELLCQINGKDVNVTDLQNQLMQAIFPMLHITKPSFRHIIAHNIRYDDFRLNNTLNVIHPYTKVEEYETLYLFMFGCNYNKGQKREELLSSIANERKFLNRLQRTHTRGTYKAALEDTLRAIAKLEDQRARLNINPRLEENMQELTRIKELINAIGSERNSLSIRKSIVEETIQDINNQTFECDNAQLELIYRQASSLVSTLQHTFEEMVAYHNSMLAKRVEFIQSELPALEEQIANLTERFNELRTIEEELTKKVTSSDTFEILEDIINKLNEQYTKKGEYTSIIEQIDEVDKELKQYLQELHQIDNELFTDGFRKEVESQLAKFNAIFAEVSEELYGERYAVMCDTTTDKNGQWNYRFAIVDINLSAGKKQGEISCFDIAYTMFADKEGIPCLHFILNDKKELMHDNQLITLAEVAKRENIQFVVSMLQDKLPEQLKKEEFYVVKLSEDEKLFKF